MARCSDPLRSVDYQRIWNPTIWKQDFLKVWFQMVRFFKRSGYSYCYSHSPNHLKTGPYEIQTFLSEIQIVFDKMAAICWFQMVGLLDFGSHSKSRPFEAQPLFDHSKSRLVWISDPHFIRHVLVPYLNGSAIQMSVIQIPTKVDFNFLTQKLFLRNCHT